MKMRISELTSSCLTRGRAREACSALAARDDGSDVRIELDDAEFLSLSLLDEFVSGLAKAGTLPRVTFVAERPEYVDRLGRVRDASDVELFREEHGERRPVRPKPAPTLVAVPDVDTPPGEL